MRSRRPVALVAAMALAAGGLAACGDDDEDTAATPPPPAAQTEPEAEGAAAARRTVEVSADPSKIAFEQKSLEAPSGSVTFAFTNPADIPHDFQIEQDGEEVGGTEVITKSEESLNVDLEPGAYTYYCSVGDHREEGMEGELTVK
jgi:plastocyanin